MNPKGIPSNYVQNERGEYCHPDRIATRPVARLLPTEPKPNPLPALDKKPQIRRQGPRRVAVVVTLIRVSKAMLDDDNLASCFKGTRDAIAKSLGIDDGDYRIKWEYAQILSGRGRVGSIVKIERI